MEWLMEAGSHVVAFLAGAGICGLLPWLIKRWIQRTPVLEHIQHDQERMKTITEYFCASTEAARHGCEVAVPASVAESLKIVPIETQHALVCAVAWALKSEYTCALLLEREGCDQETLRIVRTAFARSFAQVEQHIPQAIDHRPELARKAMYAYFNWIQNPSDGNLEARQHAFEQLSAAIKRGDVKVAEN